MRFGIKKVLLIFLAAIITSGLCACGNGNENPQDASSIDGQVASGGNANSNPQDTYISITDSTAKGDNISASELPQKFVVGEHDKMYFQPDTDDFIVVTYELPITLYVPEWFNYLGHAAYGYAGAENQSTVKVTQMYIFDGEYQLGTKIRVEYASVEDAMTATTVYDQYLIPQKLGLPDKSDDTLVTAEYFENLDKQLFGAVKDEVYNGYTAEYKGHFDNIRYFEIVFPDQTQIIDYSQSWNAPTAAFQNTGHIYLGKNSYSAGEIVSVPRYLYDDSDEYTQEMTLFSSVRSYSPPEPINSDSDESVLDELLSLPQDPQHFSPLTDDYLIVVYSYNEAYDFQTGDPQESIIEQISILFSFDDNGNLVQECARSYKKGYITDETFFKTGLQIEKENTYYSNVIGDRENGVIYSERQMGEADSSYKTKEELIDEYSSGENRFYVSKP